MHSSAGYPMTADDILHEPVMDDMTACLHIQQFLDQWCYSLMHAGLIMTYDRVECMKKALDLFQVHGVVLDEDEKQHLAEMEDEELIPALAAKMDPHLRKTFDHFKLQLQLVINTATRVRRALEEGSPEEVARVNADADAGISQQILVQTVLEAGKDVGDLVRVGTTWKDVIATQVKRLVRCAEQAEQCRREYMSLSAQIDAFGGDQKSKAKGVLASMVAGNESALKQSCFAAWMGMFLQYKSEKHIHDMFRAHIEDAQNKLMEFKMGNKKNAKGVLDKRNLRNNEALKADSFIIWHQRIYKDKEDRELAGKMAEAQAKLGNFKQSQQENTKKVMTRMTAGNDKALLSLCLQALVKYVQDYKKNKDFEDAVKASEQMLQAHMAKKSGEAKKMLGNVMGSTDTGLMNLTFDAWMKDYLEEKAMREHLESLSAANCKFSDLSQRQKKAAKNIAGRTNDFDAENLTAQIFIGWSTNTRINRVMHHYHSKLNSKKHTLDSVQTMFKSFATQLDQGLSSTPRSKVTNKYGAPESKPPAMPS